MFHYQYTSYMIIYDQWNKIITNKWDMYESSETFFDYIFLYRMFNLT